MALWTPGSYGVGRLHWHVLRCETAGHQEQLTNRRGNPRWFGSYDSAKRAADIANGAAPIGKCMVSRAALDDLERACNRVTNTTLDHPPGLKRHMMRIALDSDHDWKARTAAFILDWFMDKGKPL